MQSGAFTNSNERERERERPPRARTSGRRPGCQVCNHSIIRSLTFKGEFRWGYALRWGVLWLSISVTLLVTLSKTTVSRRVFKLSEYPTEMRGVMRSSEEERKNVSQIHFSRTRNYGRARRSGGRGGEDDGVCGALLLIAKIMSPAAAAAAKRKLCGGRGRRRHQRRRNTL